MLTKKEITTVSLFCAVYISWGLTDSIQAPFYPKEASAKGATPAEYGFVFGVIHLAIFICGPIFGKYMHKLGVKKVYCYGVVQTAVCALLFGTLDFVEDKTLFLGLSYLLRILEGVAEAASWSAVFAMLLHMFPDNVATIYATTEASFALAEMLGPTLGAFLYEAGGFVLPFVICGTLCLITGLVTIFVLPNENNLAKHEEEVEIIDDEYCSEAEEVEVLSSHSRLLAPHPESILYGGSKPSRTMSVRSEMTSRTKSVRSHRTSIYTVQPKKVSDLWPVLSNPRVLAALLGTVFGASVEGMLEANLEPFLEVEMKLSITQVGFTFLALSIPYFIASPSWGHVCDHWANPKVIQPIGHVVTFFGLLVLAPVGYMTDIIPQSYTTTIIGLVLLGIGTAALLVASFSGAQKSALESLPVTPDEIYSVISGIWTSAFALGNFIGPTLSGFLTESLGFESTTTVFQIMGLVLLFVDIINLFCCKQTRIVARRKRDVSLKITKANEKYDLYERVP